MRHEYRALVTILFFWIFGLIAWAAPAHAQFTATTTVNISVCGNGIPEPPVEVCDDGTNNGQYAASGGTRNCLPDCSGYGPYCGDGVVQANREQCDDGMNTGAYGTCAPGCVLGPRCGDGIVQADQGEECDEGNMNGAGCDGNGTGCTPACKVVSVR